MLQSIGVTMSQTQFSDRTRSLETILHLPFDLYAFFFSYLIAVDRTLSTTLNKNHECTLTFCF